jgi:PAS domain S-box-containing protein
MDITERKRAEEELLRRQTELQVLFDLMPAMIWFKDTKNGILRINRRAADATGKPVEELEGRSMSEVYPQEADKYYADDLEVIGTGAPKLEIVERLQGADGREIWIQTDKVPVCGKDGNTIGIVVMAQDITERKQAEESLALFRNLVDGSPDAIEVIDPETGRFLDVNTTGCKRLGYSREEMLALKLADIDVEKDYRTLWPVVVEEIKKAGFAAIIGQHRRKDGTTFPVEVNARYINLNRGYMVAVVRDITERKRIESRFRLLVDSNVQGVLFWTRDGKIFGANNAFLKIVGYTREDMEAGRINWMELTPPEFAHLDRRALEEITATGVCTPYEKEFILADGSRVPVFLGSAAFKDNPDEGVAFVLDLTERKKLEQQFLRAQRMESIGTLAGGVAHDLNNILAPIMMSIHLLKGFADDPEAKDILETIEASAKRGADIVKQVLSFARGLEGERVEVQPRDLLKDLETIIKDTFPRDIRLQFSIPNNSWMILGDPTQMHQILLNLCINARDAMPGGGSLSISVENCTLDEHYAAMNTQAKAGRHVLISVTDSGTGMPPELLDKIFEPFFTTKERGQGTGLGLSTVFAIVKSHGGFINVYSEIGKGTNFKIYLPASETPSDEQRKLSQEVSMPRGKGETVLVIDDEPSILNIASKTLQAFGYKVLTATDGADGMAVYLEHKAEIAVVLTDMMMPIMDGPATIHALTRIDPNLKIIAASGLNTHGEITKVTGMGIKHFLTKPYTAAILLKTLRAILDKG